MCPVLIRFLVHMYTSQKIRVRWLSHVSQQYPICNGIKQGGVLSPILFAVFVDELLAKLQNSNAGCQMEGVFMGAQGYADDICLLAPSASGMRKMLRICENFAEQFHVLFNASKSALIVHSSNRQTHDNVEMNLSGEAIPQVTSSKHLVIVVGHKGMEQTAQKAVIMYIEASGTICSNHIVYTCMDARCGT